MLPAAFFANASAFLSRLGQSHRQIELEQMTLAEQAQLFASPAARLVIGVHGAGLSNLIFSPIGHAVLEVYSAAFPCYRTLAVRRGLLYRDFAYGFRFVGPMYYDERVAQRTLDLMREQGGWPALIQSSPPK